MKYAILLTALATYSLYATDSGLLGNYTLIKGDSACDSSISLINKSVELSTGTFSGIRLVQTRDVGSTFEDEGAIDFLNINKGSIVDKTKNSSHGETYTQTSNSVLKAGILTKDEVVKTTILLLQVEKNTYKYSLKLNDKNLDYTKIINSSATKCTYQKN
jgi:hypothetical protein